MASGKPGPLHFSLVIFVMATLILSVVTYVVVNDLSETKTKLATQTDAAGKFERISKNREVDLNALREQAGYRTRGGHELGEDLQVDARKRLDDLPIRGDAESVIAEIKADIKSAFGGKDNASLRSALFRLKNEKDALKTEFDKTKALAQTQEELLAVLNKEYKVQANRHKTKSDQYNKDLTKVVADKDKAVKKKDEEIGRLDKGLKKEKDKFNELERLTTEQIAKLNKDKRSLVNINDFLADKVYVNERKSYERPDGLIRWVDAESQLVWINRGRADKLTTRTQFSVYKQDHQGVGRPAGAEDEGELERRGGSSFRGVKDIKGAIEVTRVISAHLSEARILKTDLYDPLQEGDPIYTPLWDPGAGTAMSFVGLMDIDGDGKSDRVQLHEMIQGIGGKVIHELLDDGRRVVYTKFPQEFHEFDPKDDPEINVQSKFLVIGEVLSLSEAATDEEKNQREIMLKHRRVMGDEARKNAIQRINLSDFLSFIGYVPQRSVFVPGLTNRPYDLKAGAASQRVGGTVGERASSGKVSSVYTRSKRLKKQPVSTGKTSGLYDGGN